MGILNFKKTDCKNCYKCLRECPVKAISMLNNQAQIVEELCILCGRCTNVCPQNAKEVINTVGNVRNLLDGNEVVASVAPSFISNFKVKDFQVIKAALLALGFSDAVETAIGAKYVDLEYNKILDIKKYPNFITSCCPAVNNLIAKYYPNALKYLAPVDSPMVAHAKMIKKERPNSKVVFIGPCIAKKDEAYKSHVVDEAITFIELKEMFTTSSIDIDEYNEKDYSIDDIYNSGRFYPIDRGVIKSLKQYSSDYDYLSVSGIHECMDFLNHIDKVSGMFVEMNACQHSCVNGPAGLEKEGGCMKAIETVRKYTKNTGVNPINVEGYSVDVTKDFAPIEHSYKIPSELELKAILATYGKYTKAQELNCGACGYNTCREKAIAVYNNMAEKEMCLPFMKEQAESLSNEIIRNSPNGIVSIDENNIIIDCNEKASELLGINMPIAKNPLSDVYEINAIATALLVRKPLYTSSVHIEKTDKDLEITSVYVDKAKISFAILRDCTLEEETQRKLKEYRENTLDLTNSVIDKQMRTVQEIASLLGETTAETKLAIYKLRKILLDNEDK